ncbi:MAG: TonB family protein [Desulfuromonadales bacterium]
MFSQTPSFLRLSLCLLLSTGVHGGLVYPDWGNSPVESRLIHAPVVVSLLPDVDAAVPAAAERILPAPEPAPRQTLPHDAPAETLTGKPLSVAVDKPKSEQSLMKPSAEAVSMLPQEAASDRPPGLFKSDHPAIEPVVTEPTSAEAPDKALRMVLPGDVRGLLDSPVDIVSALSEATPYYRSNPLPEYPRLARQKHWEGVVWLMVDVSADGLVDNLRVERSCGHQVLDRAAHRTVSRWQFSPAKRGGLPVSSQVRIPVRFHLEDG